MISVLVYQYKVAVKVSAQETVYVRVLISAVPDDSPSNVEFSRLVADGTHKYMSVIARAEVFGFVTEKKKDGILICLRDRTEQVLETADSYQLDIFALSEMWDKAGNFERNLIDFINTMQTLPPLPQMARDKMYELNDA